MMSVSILLLVSAYYILGGDSELIRNFNIFHDQNYPLMQMLQQLTNLADFFLPRICPACKKKLTARERYVCPECISGIKPAEPERLEREFNRKFLHDKLISEFFSMYVFEKDKALQHIIHSFKYEGRYRNAIYMGELLGEKLKEKNGKWNIDYIIPAPLHAVKKAERGYNQAYYIAKGITAASSIPMKDNVIRRKKYTESQTTMDLRERKENISGAFVVKNTKAIAGKNILLLDDVITTGSTLTECAKVLLDNGAGKIYAASIAIAD
jgi:ComF family protein